MKTIQLFITLTIALTINTLQAETVTYYVNDLVGSPVAAMDQNGNVLWRESYNPFGESRLNPSQNSNDIGFTGHQKDDATGLTYMQARYYDPVVGRFYGVDSVKYTSKNPVMSFNRYLYVNNNPFKYVDPDGKNPLLLCLTPFGAPTCVAVGQFIVDAAVVVVGVTGIIEITQKSTTQKKKDEKKIKNANDSSSGNSGNNNGKKAQDSGKNSRHGDLGRTKDKTRDQIENLQDQADNASGKEKQKLIQKIKNIKKNANKKKKGEEHGRRNKKD